MLYTYYIVKYITNSYKFTSNDLKINVLEAEFNRFKKWRVMTIICINVYSV